MNVVSILPVDGGSAGVIIDSSMNRMMRASANAAVPEAEAATPDAEFGDSSRFDSAVESPAVSAAKLQVLRLSAEIDANWLKLGRWLVIIKDGVPEGAYLAFLAEANIEPRKAERIVRIVTAPDHELLRPLGYTRGDIVMRLKPAPRATFLKEYAERLPTLSSRALARLVAERMPKARIKPRAVPLARLTAEQLWALGVYQFRLQDLSAEALATRHALLVKLLTKKPELLENLASAKPTLDDLLEARKGSV